MYDYWQAEENKHAKAYTDYMNRIAGSIRFRKEIDYHVKKQMRHRKKRRSGLATEASNVAQFPGRQFRF